MAQEIIQTVTLKVDSSQVKKLKEDIQNIKPVVNLDVKTDKTKVQELIKNIGNVNKQVDILNNKEISPKIDGVNDELRETESILTDISKTRIDLIIEDSKSTSSIQELKQQIRELEGIALQAGDANSEAFQKATQAAGQLKDRLEDVKDATRTFTAGDPLEGLSKGFGNLKNKILDLDFQGFSEEASRLGALSNQVSFQGLSDSLGGVTKGFANLGKVLLTNPIFLLVGTIALIVANFDNLLDAIDGVSSEQLENLDIAKEQLKVEQDKSKALDLQENTLKLQGKTEKEILDLKIAQTDEEITKAQIALDAQKEIADAELQRSIENQKYFQIGVEQSLSSVRILLESIDAIGKSFGKNFGLAEGFDDFTKDLIFDPEEVKKEGDEATLEAQNTLNELVSKRDGYKLRLKAIGKEEADNAIENKKLETDTISELETELTEAQLTEQQKRLSEVDKYYNERLIKLNEAFVGEERLSQEYLDAVSNLEKGQFDARLKVYDEFIQESKDKNQGFVDFLQQNDSLATTEEKNQSEIDALSRKYDTELNLARQNATDQLEVQNLLQEEINRVSSEGGDVSGLQAKYNTQVEAAQTAANLVVGIETQKKESLNQLDLVQEQREKELQDRVNLAGASDEEIELANRQKQLDGIREFYNEQIRLAGDNAAKRKELEDAAGREIDAKKEEFAETDKQREERIQAAKLQLITGGLSAISGVITAFAGKSEAQQKKAFELNKKVQIAEALIQGYSAIQGVLSSSSKNPTTVPFPAYPYIQAGIMTLTTIANVKKIASTQFQGGGTPAPSTSTGAEDSSGGAPPTPSPFQAPQFFGVGQTQQGNPLTPQPIVIQNNIVETDITSTQREVGIIETRATLV